MANLFTRILLFVSSYFPLTAIISVQLASKKHVLAALITAGVGSLGLAGLLIYLQILRKLNPMSVSILTAERRDSETMSYIVTYLLPFLALTSGTLADSISLGVFLIVLAILYVNSDMLYVNPVLNLLKWHVYAVTIADGEGRMLLTKRRVRSGSDVEVVRVGDDILLEVKR